MQIRIRATGQVLLEHEWIKWVATTHGKSISVMTAEVCAMFDSDPVFEGPQATGGTVYQYSQRDGVEQQSDGKWYTKYILGPVFTDGETTAAEQEAAYKAMKDAEFAKAARDARDRLLTECDWVVTKAIEQNAQDNLGIQIPVVWLNYRQALRDLPQQSGFPVTIVWPVKP
jgi:hypothetical protein